MAEAGEVPDPIMTLSQHEIEQLYQSIGFELRRQKYAQQDATAELLPDKADETYKPKRIRARKIVKD